MADIEFSKPDKDGNRTVTINSAVAGALTRPKFAPKSTPGWFLTLNGVTWNNAPGARYVADAGGGAPSTYVTSLTQAKERIKQHLKDKDGANVG